MRVVGLMSGTSLDGVDAAVVDLEESDGAISSWTLTGFHTRPYAPAERDRIRSAIDGGGAGELCRLGVDLAAWLGEAALSVCDRSGIGIGSVDLIGSHGQTIWHIPPVKEGSAPGGSLGASLQIGDPAVLAERLKTPVVSDFRSADIAAGGQGAPLVPFADRVLFADPVERRAIQNLGGMANVTLLGTSGAVVTAFDTGPGVALLDRVAARASGGRHTFDLDGRLALAGSADPGLVDRLLGDPFFAQAPPRSTGRERFGDELVDGLVTELGLEGGSLDEGWSHLMATFVEVTARSIGDAYRRWVVPEGLDAVYLMGGGARNPALHAAIQRSMDGVPVRGGEELGLDPDAREATAFAILAWAHLRGVPSNVPHATGASGARILGSFTPAPPSFTPAPPGSGG